MLELQISGTAQAPVYRQIADQVRQLIATERLRSGDHLPTVRQLAHTLGVSPGTVVRAYVELEQEGVVVSRRGGGTFVSARADDPQLVRLRQARLSNMVSDSILETLSRGYSPEELEEAFSVHVARWRAERRGAGGPLQKRHGVTRSGNTVLIVGSHDLALDLLVSQVRKREPDIVVHISHAGSLGGLIALQEERADLAGIHLLDEETGEYNYPYVKHVLPGRAMAIVHLAYRIQGLMVAEGNPKRIRAIEDLGRPDVNIVNRQKGSGTRVLLDLKLRQQGISPSHLRGYEREVDTHLAVATSVARGEADAGLGIEAAARSFQLSFLPLFRERYDLVIPMEHYRSGRLAPLLEAIAGTDFRKAVSDAGGYDTSQTGTTAFLNHSR
jgi:molybdate-binding protein/DNA-binding transcriptional regulator YhcF (GntR family)